MSCKVEIKSLDFLQEKGAINSDNTIKDKNKFDELNQHLTNLADTVYDIKSPENELLFNVEQNEIFSKDGSSYIEYDVKPNVKLFNLLQKATDDSNGIFEIQKPVDYKLKAVDILESPRAIEIFNKGIKNNWSIDKILTELQIPKEQKAIIIQSGKNDRVEILTDLLANHTFSVEVDVTKSGKLDFQKSTMTVAEFDALPVESTIEEEVNEFLKIENEVKRVGDMIYRVQIVEDDRTDSVYEVNKEIGTATQHYSYLTVPGGVNYRENEISTPEITPSIKGHARFSTINGIGWFRSDDKAIPNYQNIDTDIEQAQKDLDRYRALPVYQNRQGNWLIGMQGAFETKEEAIKFNNKRIADLERKLSTATKTRRILEYQSDLFQKGRGKSTLVNAPVSEGLVYKLKHIGVDIGQKFNVKGTWFEVFDKKVLRGHVIYNVKNLTDTKKTAWMTTETIAKAVEDYYNSNKPANDFLQLLNNNNAWVSFFVKSIVQDSIKKGYDTVLFPLGNTANKVEGMQTVEDFIKSKKERLAELENYIDTNDNEQGSILFDKEYITGNNSVEQVPYSEFNNVARDEKRRVWQDVMIGTTEFGYDHWYQDGLDYYVQLDSDEYYRVPTHVYKRLEIDAKNKLRHYRKIEVEDEIKTVQQEIQNAEEQGGAAFSTIYSFYENVTPNVLKKAGLNPEKFVDEHGNGWMKVDLNRVPNGSILLKEADLTKFEDDSAPTVLQLEELNAKEPFTDENERGTINEFILFGNQEGKKQFTAIEILNNIIDNYDGFSTDGKFFLDKAKLLVTATKAKVRLVNKEQLSSEKTIMQYNGITNTIDVSLDNLRDLTTEEAVSSFLHEVVHSVSIGAYYNPTTPSQLMFRQQIREAYQYYKENYSKEDIDKRYGFVNEVEFIAEIYTNPRFAEDIRQIDSARKLSLWKRILDAIRSLFGLSIKYNDIVDNITRISTTAQSVDKNTIFEKQKIDDPYIHTATVEERFAHTLSRIDENLAANIRSLQQTKRRTYNNKKLKNIQGYINDLKKLRKQLNEYRETNQFKGIELFVTRIKDSLNYIENTLDKVDKTNQTEVQNIIRIYSDYLTTFSVIKDVSRTVADIKGNLNDQSIATKKDIDEIENALHYANGKFNFVQGRMQTLIEQGMESILNDIKYHKDVEYKHRKRLEKEHKDSKSPEDRETWIVDKMLNRDKDKIAEDVKVATNELIQNANFDILGADVLFGNFTSVSSKLIQVMGQIITDIKNEKNKIIQGKDKELQDLFQELSSEKNSTNPETLYKNILEFDEKGQPFFKGDYKIEFYDKVRRKIEALESQRKQLIYEYEIELDDIKEEKGSESAEYKAKKTELENKTQQIASEIAKIEKDNFEFDKYKVPIRPLAKWKNNFSNLSVTEMKVLKLAKERLEEARKNTLAESSLITRNKYETKFYELPKVTKSNLERMLKGDVKGIAKDVVKDISMVRPDDIGYTTVRTDLENNKIYNLKVHFRDKTGNFDHKDQSLDVFNLLRLETENGFMYKMRKDSQVVLNSLLDIAKNKQYYVKEGTNKLVKLFSKKYDTIDGSNSNTYKMMRNLMEQKYYDIFNKNQIKLNKVDLNKTIKFINSSSAFFTLSLNIASGTANVLNAKTQLFLESLIKGKFITRKSVAKADMIYAGDLRNILADYTKPVHTSFVNQVDHMFDIADTLHLSKSGFLGTNMIKAGYDKNALQIFQTSGEHWIQSVTTMAVLDGVKALDSEGRYINKDGKVTTDKKEAASLLDMLQVDKTTGLVTMSPNVVYTTHSRLTKWDEGGKSNIDMLIKKKLYDVLGNYTQMDQPDIMRHWGGKLMMLYRKYFIPMGQRRFRNWESALTPRDKMTDDQLKFSFALQENDEGTYVSLIRFITSTLNGLKQYTMSQQWNQLTDFEKHNIRHAITEVIFMYVILPAVATLIGAAAADDGDDDAIYFAAYELRRLQTELQQYTSMSETFKMMRSPIPSARIIETATSTFGHLLTPWTLDEKYKAGPHKNENKFKIKLLKQIPAVKEFYRTWEDLYEYQKSQWGTGVQ